MATINLGDNWSMDTSSDGSTWSVSDSTTYFQVSSGGPVEVLNAKLQTGSIQSNDGRLDLQTIGEGSSGVAITDEANGQDLFVVSEGGPAEVKNTDLRVQGNLRFNNSSTIKFDDQNSGGKFFAIRDGDDTEFFRVDSTGPVKVKNSTLQIKGDTAVVSSDGEYTIKKNADEDGEGVINFKT